MFVHITKIFYAFHNLAEHTSEGKFDVHIILYTNQQQGEPEEQVFLKA